VHDGSASAPVARRPTVAVTARATAVRWRRRDADLEAAGAIVAAGAAGDLPTRGGRCNLRLRRLVGEAGACFKVIQPSGARAPFIIPRSRGRASGVARGGRRGRRRRRAPRCPFRASSWLDAIFTLPATRVGRVGRCRTWAVPGAAARGRAGAARSPRGACPLRVGRVRSRPADDVIGSARRGPRSHAPRSHAPRSHAPRSHAPRSHARCRAAPQGPYGRQRRCLRRSRGVRVWSGQEHPPANKEVELPDASSSAPPGIQRSCSIAG